jgi:shikimate kinase
LERVLALEGPLVLATGAGCVESFAARRLLQERARTLWLRGELAELARRMRADPTLRPALYSADPVAEIPLVAARRAPLYAEVAQHALDCGLDSVERVVERVLELLEREA